MRVESSPEPPALVSQGVLCDEFPAELPGLDRRVREKVRERRVQGRKLVAAEWRDLLEGGAVPNQAALARLMGVSRARVTQVLRR